MFKRSGMKLSSVALLLILALLAGCSSAKPTSTDQGSATTGKEPAAPAGPMKGGTVTVAWEVPRDTLDQHQSNHTISRMVARHFLDTLVVVNRQDGSINPALAEKWTVSPDGLSYTFNLRKGVKFHDGAPFNAEAVKFNLDRVVSPDIKPGLALKLLGGKKYKGTEVKDEFTVVVTFNEPHAAFLNGLSDSALGINSPEAVKKAGADYGRTTVVGTGPFKFVEFVDKSHVTLVRNEEYNWGPAIYGHTGPAYLEKIIFKGVPEVDSRRSALETGEAQYIRANEQLAGDLKAMQGVTVDLVPKTGTSRWYLLNAGKAPTDDVKVRQAISLAVDREAIIKSPTFGGVAKVAILPLAAANWARDTAPFKPFNHLYDPEKAKKLLDEAGWKLNPSTGIREKDGAKLVVELNHMPTEDGFATPAQAMLKEVGIEVKMVQGDFNAWLNNAMTGNFHMTTMSDSGWDMSVMSNFFEMGGTYNFGKFNNAEVDTLLKESNVTADAEQRRAKLAKAQEILLEQVAMVPVYDEMYVYAGKGLKDVLYDEVGQSFLYKAHLEGK